MKKLIGHIISAAIVTAWCIPAFAQGTAEGSGTAGAGVEARGEVTVGAGQPSSSLPPPQSANDPTPPPAAPSLPRGGLTEQAGVGGTQAYGRAGVLELGGSAGFSKASNFTSVSFSPTIGWFFVDNLELSAMVSINFIDAGAAPSSTYMTLLAEPSYHLPVSDKIFIFAGIGAGLAYAKGPGAGFAVAPRLGMNAMVGRSGILTPAFNFVYSTSDVATTTQGTLLAVSTSYGMNIGYTVMW
jgi:hypothetical protein